MQNYGITIAAWDFGSVCLSIYHVQKHTIYNNFVFIFILYYIILLYSLLVKFAYSVFL